MSARPCPDKFINGECGVCTLLRFNFSLTVFFSITEEKKDAGVKRKSVSADNGDAEKTTPEKKAKVVEEAPPAETEEAAA